MKPTELPDVFLNGNYEKVYSQMSAAFQDEVSLADLQELGADFNDDVTTYIFQSKLPCENGADEYNWIDASGSKG